MIFHIGPGTNRKIERGTGMSDRERLEPALWSILHEAMEHDVSYLYITGGSRPLARIGLGELEPLGDHPVSEGQILRFIDERVPEFQRRLMGSRGYARFVFSIGSGIRCRVDLIKTVKGQALIIHFVDETPPRPESLGLQEIIGELVDKKHGVFLICGRPRSGKSTVLASLAEEINRKSGKHIVWISHGAEYLFTPHMSFVFQIDIAGHGIEEGVSNLLKMAPDVLVLDMLLSHNVLEQALVLAEAGAQVFLGVQSTGTVHGLEALTRAVNYDYRQDFRNRLSRVFESAVYLELVQGVTGIVPATEVLVGIEPVRNLLRDGKFSHISETIPTGGKYGMETLQKSKERLSAKGLI